MTGLWVADSTKTYRLVKAVWVADSAKTYRPVKAIWAANSAKTYQLAYSPAPDITVSLSVGSPTWRERRITVTQVNAVRIRVLAYRSNGTLVNTVADDTAVSASNVYSFLGNPTESYYFQVIAYDTQNNTTVVNSAVTTMGAVPPPSTITFDGLDYNSVNIRWSAVAGADGYEMWNYYANPDDKLYDIPSATLAKNIPLVAGTAYGIAMKATFGAFVSGYSRGAVFRAPPVPGPAAGAYRYRPTTSSTWQHGGAQGSLWRPQADGIYHGNGDTVSSRGEQTGYFFGYQDWSVLSSSTCTRFRVWIYRTDDSGSSAQTACQWWLHKFGGRPAGDPSSLTSGGNDIGTLGRGEGKWFDLPVNWGQYLLDGTYQGVAWGSGNTSLGGRYMRGDQAGSTTGGYFQGELEFTIS